MTHPLVSIVIPCFNAEASLAEAVTSALGQTYAPVEVLVVDDGSTDDSAAVAESFGNVIRLVRGTNVGAAAARNKGVAAARGELIQFLDADDRLYPEKLARQVPMAIRHRPGMVFCDADVVDGTTGRSRGAWRTGGVPTADPVVHALRVIVQTGGPVHWRESFEKVGGFRAETPPCDDRDLHIRLACAGVTFHHLPEALYVMRRFDGSLSKRDPARGLQVQKAIGEDALAAVSSLGVLSAGRRAAFAAFFAGTGRAALRSGNRTLANVCFERAAALHPAGGLPEVYSPVGRMLARLLGPAAAEHLASISKTIRGHREIA